MADKKASGPKVPTERPDRQAAARDPKGGAEDRPGFDLGGAVEPENKGQSQLPPRGPAGSAASGSTATGRADGFSDPSGSRSLGTRAASPAPPPASARRRAPTARVRETSHGAEEQRHGHRAAGIEPGRALDR